MRKKVCVLVFIISLFTLCGCNVSSLSTLAEISRPYVGEYRCTRLMLGGENCLENFEYLKLALSYDGKFRLFYRTSDGGEGEQLGTYEMNSAGDEITFSAKAGLFPVIRTFPVNQGKICIDFSFRGKLLHAEFGFF